MVTASISPQIQQTPDEELMRRFRMLADAEAFATLVHRYEHELFGYLQRSLKSAELAEEVFQATFLRVHLGRDGFDEKRAFRPWLYAIATNQAIDALRRERRHRHVIHERDGAQSEEGRLLDAVSSTGRSPAEQAGDREERRRMQEAVRGLSALQRMVVDLVYGQGMAYREAAEVLGVPVGTVKSRLHAAIASLGRLWTGRVPLACLRHG